jgi:hypothetical protein
MKKTLHTRYRVHAYHMRIALHVHICVHDMPVSLENDLQLRWLLGNANMSKVGSIFSLGHVSVTGAASFSRFHNKLSMACC